MEILKIPFELGNPTGARGPATAPDLIYPEGELITGGDFLEINKNILKAAKGKFLAIGGDHSIAYALIKAAKPEALLYFDAHLDCEDDFLPPSHEDIIRAIVNQKIVKPENIFIIGARKFYPKEIKFIKKHKINVVGWRSKATERGVRGIWPATVKHIDSNLYNAISSFKTIYLSIDIDVFDPSEAPGTNYPVEMGVESSEFFKFLEKLDLKKIVGVDVVEVNPAKDVENKTVELARKIVEKFL
jgi:agmatinase